MKHLLFPVASVIAAALLCTASARSQTHWTQTTGIQGGQINCFEVVGSITFAGTWGGGVFASTDNGVHWTYSGLIGEKVRSLTSHLDTVYAGTHTGIYRSTDMGATWSNMTSVILYVYAMASSGNAIIGGGYQGVCRSTDGGETWALANTGLSTTTQDISISDVKAFAGPSGDLFCAVAGSGVFRSVNNGLTWTRTDSVSLTDLNVQTLAMTGSDLFVGTESGVFHSTNDGDAWTSYNGAPFTGENAKSLYISGTTLYAGTAAIDPRVSQGDGVFSTPIGASPTWSTSTGLTDGTVYAMTKNINMLAGTNGGVFNGGTTGATWSVSNSGLTATRVYALATDGVNQYAAAYGSGLFKSTDLGVTWNLQAVANSDIHSLLTSGTNVYVGSEKGFYHSTNSGTSWSVAATGLTVVSGLDVRALLQVGSSLYAGTYGGGVWVSTNGGVDWSQTAGEPDNAAIFGLTSLGTDIYAGSQGGGVYKSTDGGATWNPVNTGIPAGNPQFINVLSTSGTVLYAGTEGGGLFKSTNSGAAWTDITGNLGANFVEALYVNGVNLVVGTRNGGGLFYSKTYADPYRQIGDSLGLMDTWVSSIASTPSTMYIGISGTGVWKMSIADLGYRITASPKVFLQGPYDATGDTMLTTLNTSGTLAAHFGAIPIPALAVDSINIELRDSLTGVSTVQKYAPAWLLSNGTIRCFSDTTKAYVPFDSMAMGKYYVIIRHRNHLAIISSVGDSLDGNAAPPVYDFTTAQSKVYGVNSMKDLGTGSFALYGGNGNGDVVINAVDRNLVWRVQNGAPGYLNGDFNLSGFVNAVDQNLYWRVNNGALSQVP